MDADEPPITGHLKTCLFWAMGVFLLLAAGTLALAFYALVARGFGPELAIQCGLPPTIGIAGVMYMIAGFHRQLQSVPPLRLAVMSVILFALASALTWGIVAYVLAHPSRGLELALRLILLVVFILLFRVVWRERKK
jgi:hypothetical protein